MDPADPLVVYVGAGAEAIAETSVAALGSDADLTLCRVSFEEALSTGSGGVACLREPTPEELAWLSSLRLRRPHAPLVLVTPLAPASLRANRALHAGGPPVVWAQEVLIGLAPTLSEEVGRDAVPRIAGLLRGKAVGTPVVAGALNRIVRASPPIGQVRTLAKSLKVARRTLYDHWAATFGSGLTPKEFLEWVVLLRALSSGETTPIRMAAAIGVDVRTLERLCHRRLGVTLARAREDGTAPAASAFGERVSRLLG